jgi:hypothetical protein
MSTTRTTRTRNAVEQLLNGVAGVSDSFVSPQELIAAGLPRNLATNVSRASKRIVKSDIAELLDDLTDDLDTLDAANTETDPRRLAEHVTRV